MQAPYAFMAILEQLYHFLGVTVMKHGHPAIAWRFPSGIIQGCSLSGSMYAAVAACFLFDLQSRMEGPRLGLARACADDIGCVVKQLRALRILADVMQTAERIAALVLKLTKCLLAPLHAKLTDGMAAPMHELIRDMVPLFANVQVVSSLTYLGLVLGPAADESSCWLAPSIKG
eukprot:5396031-Pyramimonas_sp.AAC.1